jgi:DNA-binding transcriptional ArsR family regulator
MANKTTKREYFAMTKAIVEASAATNKDEILNFLAREVELLNKKSAKSGETKTQKLNKVLMETVLTVLAEIGSPVTVSELMTDTRLASYVEDENVKTMTTSKMSALLKKLVEADKVVRVEEKKKAYFSIKAAETAE